MTPLFKKLNFKHQQEVCILQHPDEFTHEADAMKPFTSILTDMDQCEKIHFVLVFVKTKPEVDRFAPIINSKLPGDGIVWFAYPKKSSKKYRAEINRDEGWEMMGELGFEGVRAVAIDEDWSALRFRRTQYVKSAARNAN